LLKDRYRPVQMIGQGGFGRTFLAIDEDKPSKPACVIKQFLPLTQNARSLKKAAELFEQEAVRLEELGSHPQIPALLAHFIQDGRQYLVQEFIAGKTLAEILQLQGALSEAQIYDVLGSLLPVLDYIHAHQVIHRDIKPANIIRLARSGTGSSLLHPPDWSVLLNALSIESAQGFRDFMGNQSRFSEWVGQQLVQPPTGLAIADLQHWHHLATRFSQYADFSQSQRQYLVADASRLLYEMRQRYEVEGEAIPAGPLVLVDFGAAKAATGTALMRTGTTIGSPEYIAPEQARGKAVFASDLYSLGVVCIQLLTNVSPLELFDSQRNAWNWRPYLPKPISEALTRILNRLLEPALHRRYVTAADVLQDLEPIRAIAPSSGAWLNPNPPSFPPPSRSGIIQPISTATLPAGQKGRPLRQRTATVDKAAMTWHCLHTLTCPGKVSEIVLHPTLPLLISSSGTTLRLWDLETGQPLRSLTGHLDIVQSLVISPDGQRVISGSADKSIRLWELESGRKLGSIQMHSDTVLSLAISPDGRLLASGSLRDPIKLWNLETHRELGDLMGHSGWVDALVFSPDGTLLVSGSTDASIKLWQLDTGKELRTLKGHTQAIAALAFSPDGKTLASASWDGTVKLWSSSTHRQKRLLSPDCGRVKAIAFSPDGKLLAIGGDTLQLWNPRTGDRGSPLEEQPGSISALAFGKFSLGGKKSRSLLISASLDGSLKIWTS